MIIKKYKTYINDKTQFYSYENRFNNKLIEIKLQYSKFACF